MFSVELIMARRKAASSSCREILRLVLKSGKAVEEIRRRAELLESFASGARRAITVALRDQLLVRGEGFSTDGALEQFSHTFMKIPSQRKTDC
jgi:hypothetical protein